MSGDTADEIVAILNKLRGLLGEGTPVSAPLPSDIPDDIQRSLDALPNGVGHFIEKLVHERKSQTEIAAELAKIDPSLGPVVERSAADVQSSRDQIENTKDQYGNRKDQLTPVEDTAAGQLALLQAKSDALTEGTSAVRGNLNNGDLRRAMVDQLAQRYYQQALAAGSGAPAQAAQQAGAGSGGGSPGGGAGGGMGSPLSAASSPLKALSGIPSLGSSMAGSNVAGSGTGAGVRDTANPAGDLTKDKANEKGLQKYTILAARAISAAFPEIQTIGGVRADSLKWHPQGLAIDVMIPNPDSVEGKALGDRVLKFVMANQDKFKIDHAIWQQTMHIPGNAPRRMENRGSPTQNHMDHVHIATAGGGYPRGDETYAL
ncbi:hypothetical protein [Mycobacteroides abscessus]